MPSCPRHASKQLALLLCTAVLLSRPLATALVIGTEKKRLLILGLGRVGLDCAKVASTQFDRILGTVTSPSQSDFPQDGIERIPFRLENIVDQLEVASHVLWTIPLDREDLVVRHVLNELQRSCSKRNKWLGLVSTSGVYGNHNGAWVSEDSPTLCEAGTSADFYRQVEQDLAHLGCQVFRCAGIYDSTKSALHTVYKNGKPTLLAASMASEGKVSRIHSYDVARAIASSMAQQYGHFRVFNLADDEPTSRSHVMTYAAELLESIGVPLSHAEVENAPTTKRARRRQAERKLVSNERMKEELLGMLKPPGLVYPTYREGLQKILYDPTTPWFHLIRS